MSLSHSQMAARAGMRLIEIAATTAKLSERIANGHASSDRYRERIAELERSRAVWQAELELANAKLVLTAG